MFRRSLYFFALCLIFWQCGQQNAGKENRSVFNYNEMNGVTSLDPAAASNFENISVVNQLYEGLLQMDDSLNILPAIAKQYSLSPDGKKYIFHLRQDVYFHDDVCFPEQKGRKVKASDFVFSFNRLFDSKVSSATSLVDLIDRDSNTAFKGFEAPDDSTFYLA
jgi:peptide/nickel transport system substrate-binding protein